MRATEQQAVITALRRPRYEVFPLHSVVDKVAEHLPAGDVTLTVTASPAKGIERTVEVAELLAAQGRRVVPHLSARLIRDTAHLEDIVERLAACGIDDALVVAGDLKEPVGVFSDALGLLTALAGFTNHFEQLGITGYPESHPFIDDDVTVQAMWDKRHYAGYVVSQVCFDPRVIAAWVRRVRRRGVELPIHVGVPGPVEPTRLLRISSSIGVGESARFIRRHTSWLRHLLRAGGYRPSRLIDGLAATIADPALNVAGFHFYTFNEVARTEQWRQATLARLEALKERA
jgi:methylenetetrahydrofolate reductase (NADPH)